MSMRTRVGGAGGGTFFWLEPSVRCARAYRTFIVLPQKQCGGPNYLQPPLHFTCSLRGSCKAFIWQFSRLWEAIIDSRLLFLEFVF